MTAVWIGSAPEALAQNGPGPSFLSRGDGPHLDESAASGQSDKDEAAAIARAEAEFRRLSAEAAAKRRAIEDRARAADDEKHRSETIEAERRAAEIARQKATAREEAAIAARKQAEEDAKAAVATSSGPAEPELRNAPATPPALTRQQIEDGTRFAARGHALLAGGEIAQARGLLERAADLGQATAALELAETYDAKTLSKWPVVGLAADNGRARFWYLRAQQLGLRQADDALRRLAQ